MPSVEQLRKLNIAPEWAEPLTETFQRFGINSVVQQGAFIGQCGHECANFKILEENLNYSAERLMQIFPSRFPTLQIAELYAENPVKLAGKIYGSRADLGNENDGDGYKYRGRGIIQITGKLNYNFCGKALGVDLITNPALLLDPENAVMSAGWFWNKSMEPEHPVTIPLQKAATNILYLPFTEVAPRISYVYNDRPIEQKYVAISTQSTSQLKLWDYWADLIELLHKEGYAVYEVSKDDCNLDVIQPEDRSLQNVMNIIKHAEFYIGLSSGISWLAWALGADVVMISNFTNADHEFTDCTRIVDTSVCHGCWNNPKFKFDKGNWMWCPKHEDTKRQFECHKAITAQHVFDKIKY